MEPPSAPTRKDAASAAPLKTPPNTQVDDSIPVWARPPPTAATWSLLEIKAGVACAKHALQQACTLFGRAADQVDVVTAHESCSRRHAQLAFDATGTPWLLDLQSTHGTTVNKRRLPAAACLKQQQQNSNTRGVVVYPGDVIQFGTSTRLYCLEGPPEWERGQQRQQTNKSTSTAATAATAFSSTATLLSRYSSEPSLMSVASTGEQQEQEDDEEDDTSHATLPDDFEAPPHLQKEWQQILGIRQKLVHLQQESDRIRAKEAEGLTAGQQGQLQRNQDRMAQLESNRADKEAALRDRLHPERRKSRNQKAQHDANDDDDDEQVDDRTHRHGHDALQLDEDGETEESLRLKRTDLVQSLDILQADLKQAANRQDQIQQRLGLLRATQDEEAFFVENDWHLAADHVHKLEKEEFKLKAALVECERLLEIVQPHWKSLDGTASSLSSNYSSADDDFVIPPAVAAKSTLSMPPPPPVVTLPSAFSTSAPLSAVADASSGNRKDSNKHDTSSSFGATMLPPPKRPRVVSSSSLSSASSVAGPTMPPPPPRTPPTSPRTVQKTSTPPPPPSSSSVHGKTTTGGGTLAALQAFTSSSTTAAASQSSTQASLSPLNPTDDDPKKDAWKPPKDQDGSGRTRLNTKFAGRY